MKERSISWRTGLVGHSRRHQDDGVHIFFFTVSVPYAHNAKPILYPMRAVPLQFSIMAKFRGQTDPQG